MHPPCKPGQDQYTEMIANAITCFVLLHYTMKSLLVVGLLLLCCAAGYGQGVGDWAKPDPPPVEKAHHGLALKAKIWIWPLFFTAIQTGFGVEYAFKDVHALALEGEYSFYSFPNDTGDNIGPRIDHVFEGITLTYKRYCYLRHGVVYAGAFIRDGKMLLDIEQGYRTDTLSLSQNQYSVGAIVGMTTPISKRLDIDWGIGVFYKEKFTHKVELVDGAISDTHQQQGNFGLRLTADIVYIFKRKKCAHLISGNFW